MEARAAEEAMALAKQHEGMALAQSSQPQSPAGTR